MKFVLALIQLFMVHWAQSANSLENPPIQALYSLRVKLYTFFLIWYCIVLVVGLTLVLCAVGFMPYL